MALPGTAVLRRGLRAYRASGADLPFGDPLPAHDVAMEGYFWRFTDPATGRVLIALNGVNRGHARELGRGSQAAIEHEAVLTTMRALERRGWRVSRSRSQAMLAATIVNSFASDRPSIHSRIMNGTNAPPGALR